MSQVCAAEGCTHDQTVFWQPELEAKDCLRLIAFYRSRRQGRAFNPIPLCQDHASAVRMGTRFQFKHKASRFIFEGKEITPYAPTAPAGPR